MKTSVIVPTHNRRSMVERLLANLLQCEFPADVDIWIVENGSRSGIEELCSANTVGGRVRYLHSSDAGQKSLALNYGMRSSHADFFVFFDDDIRAPHDIVRTYVEAAQRYGPGHFFGGPLVADAEVACPAHLLPYLPWSATGKSFGEQEREIHQHEFEYFIGSNWAVFRADIEKAGRFAEYLGPSEAVYSPLGEETDLQQRLMAASVRAVYLPRAVIYHFVARECYTLRWAKHRSFRLGLTNSISAIEDQGRSNADFKKLTRLIYNIAKANFKIIASFLIGFSIERRTGIKIYEAYLRGALYGTSTSIRGMARTAKARSLFSAIRIYK